MAKGRNAPELISTLINMVLAYIFIFIFRPRTITDKLFHGQLFVQNLLILVAVACVPIILLVKPLIITFKFKRRVNSEIYEINQPLLSNPTIQGLDVEIHGSELYIHQGIEVFNIIYNRQLNLY